MSDRYRIIWAKTAEKDLKNIIEYIAEENPLKTLDILAKIRKKSSDLYTLPEKSRIVPELKEQGIFLYRELIISPWRLIYRISGKEIYVLSVIDSRRNIEDILFNRFIDLK